jgi:hypothetical protein
VSFWHQLRTESWQDREDLENKIMQMHDYKMLPHKYNELQSCLCCWIISSVTKTLNTTYHTKSIRLNIQKYTKRDS